MASKLLDRLLFIADCLKRFRLVQVTVAIFSLALAGWFLSLVVNGEFADAEMRLETSLQGLTRVNLDRKGWTKSQKYQLLTKLGLMRETALIESLPQPLPDTERRRGVGLIFLTYAGLQVPDVWEWWLDDAYKWIHDQGLEDPSISPSESKILRPAIHYFFGFERDYINECASPHLKDTALHVVGEGRWGDLQPNIQVAYSQVLQKCPDCYFIALISHNSIPLKRFMDWYPDLIGDARSRANFHTPVYNVAYPGSKSSLWRTLIRPHVEAVVNYPVDPYLANHLPWGACGEEYWPLYQISQYIGEHAYSQIKCARLFERGAHHGYILASTEACPHAMEQYECWDGNCKGSWDGDYQTTPFPYFRILQSHLDSLIDNSETFFARKFQSKSRVVSDLKNPTSETLVTDYIREKLHLNSTWSHLDSDCELPHPFAKLRGARTKDKIRQALLSTCLPGLKPEYRNATCETTSMKIFTRTNKEE